MSPLWPDNTGNGRPMMQLARRFYNLERGDRRLVVEAFILIAIVNAALRTMSFVSLRRLLDRAKALRSRSPHSAGRISWAVAAAARRLPGRTCLKDSLVADVMLRRRGYQSTLRLGVKKAHDCGGPLQAHAWVESDGTIVVGELDTLHEYRPLS